MGKLSQVELALGVGYYRTKFSTYMYDVPKIPELVLNLVWCTCLVHLSFIFWKSSLLVQLHVHLSIIFLKSSKTNVRCSLAEHQ